MQSTKLFNQRERTPGLGETKQGRGGGKKSDVVTSHVVRRETSTEKGDDEKKPLWKKIAQVHLGNSNG